MIIAIYVENLLLCGTTRTEIKKIKDALKAKFQMSDLELVPLYLGMAVIRRRANRIFCLGQKAYLEIFFQNHGIWDCKANSVPMDGTLIVRPQDYQATDSFQTQYQSTAGSLMYTMLGIRLDLAFSVFVVSQYASNPNCSHWQAVKRIFRYIHGTFPPQLTYRWELSNLQRYTNADRARNKDTCRSTSGYIFTVGSGVIS